MGVQCHSKRSTKRPDLGGGKGLVERCGGVRVEIILDEDDRLGFGEVDVGQVLQDVGVVDGGAPVGDLDVAPSFERREHHEQVGDPLPVYPGMAQSILTG